MRELSLHILDIVQNSIAAEASRIRIMIQEEPAADRFWFEIQDNGCGMDEVTLASVTDPFFTTRTTRRVGLGIPMLKFTAMACQGNVEIESEPGKGTRIKASYQLSHIDRPPLGDMANTMLTLILGSELIDFVYCHRLGQRAFEFSTSEMREILGDVPFSEPEVTSWLRGFLAEGESALYKEADS
ncbi:MAG TPA: ATP-binding protein [Peptococcaceae bacterium]|nr:ATP-binding protein [Peptococcaceae bacterium]